MQDQDPDAPIDEPEAEPPPAPAPSAADALAEAAIELRRSDFRSSLPRLLAALFDPPPSSGGSEQSPVTTSSTAALIGFRVHMVGSPSPGSEKEPVMERAPKGRYSPHLHQAVSPPEEGTASARHLCL